MKRYEQFINESVRDKMIPKSEDDIKRELSKLSQNSKNAKLRHSVDEGDTESVKLLLEVGADVHYQEEYSLRFASRHGLTSLVKVLLDHGASIDKFNGSALTNACYTGAYDTVKVLLEYGADTRLDDEAGLRFASVKGFDDIVNLIQQYNKTNEKVEYTFKTDYHKQRYQEDLDLINNAKVGDVLPHGVVYQYVEYLTLMAGQAKYEDCFVDGDLAERLEYWDSYTLKELPMDKVGTWEWNTDQSDVEAYKMKYLENKEYPPIVVDKFSPGEDYYCIIDGTHRAKALKKAGETTILAFVGK